MGTKFNISIAIAVPVMVPLVILPTDEKDCGRVRQHAAHYLIMHVSFFAVDL